MRNVRSRLYFICLTKRPTICSCVADRYTPFCETTKSLLAVDSRPKMLVTQVMVITLKDKELLSYNCGSFGNVSLQRSVKHANGHTN